MSNPAQQSRELGRVAVINGLRNSRFCSRAISLQIAVEHNDSNDAADYHNKREQVVANQLKELTRAKLFLLYEKFVVMIAFLAKNALTVDYVCCHTVGMYFSVLTIARRDELGGNFD
jgi:hypothetical protein